MAITDLTNTTWTINSLTCTAGYGEFSVDYSVALSWGTMSEDTLCIGYTFSSWSLASTANAVAYDLSSYIASVGDVITFTGGTDVTNTDLISWLEANGTCTSGANEPTLTYDLTTLNLGEGTHTISVIAKADGYKASAASASVEYTVEPQGVTLAKGTYVALDKPLLEALYEIGSTPINFTSGGVNFTSMSVSIGYTYQLNYGTTTAYGYDGGAQAVVWKNTAYKTITLDIDQTVSAEFGEWFNANFTKQADIKGGVYIGADVPSVPEYNTISQNFSFTSNGTSYTSMNMESVDEDMPSLYYGSTRVCRPWGSGWTNSAYKTINITTTQTVNPEFGNWFNANFTKRAEDGGATN